MENSTTKTARKPRAKKVDDQPTFETLSALNVNDKTENRNGYTYLSWAWAWSEFKKQHPDANYEIIKTEQGKPYLVDEFGILVQTRVTIPSQNRTHEMWLPVMDNSNNAQKSESYDITFRSGKSITVAPATMMDINKALMRCLVKNLAMFGLGIYIYAGEDLPDGYVAPPPPKEKLNSKRFNDALEQIKLGNYHEDQLRDKFDLSKAQEKTLIEYLESLVENANDVKQSLKQ